MLPAPFALERFFARHEFSARYLLSASNCQGLAMSDLLAASDPRPSTATAIPTSGWGWDATTLPKGWTCSTATCRGGSGGRGGEVL